MAALEQCTVLVGEARVELLEYAVAMLLYVACYLMFFLLNTSRVILLLYLRKLLTAAIY